MKWIRVRGLPQAKGSMRAWMPRGSRFPVLTSTNRNLKGWEQLVRTLAQEHAPGEVSTTPVELTLLFEMPKPVKHPKIKHVPHIKRPDLDKLIRAVNDALIGVWYRDDSQVINIHASKFYGNAPGVLIGIKDGMKYEPPLTKGVRS